MLSNPIQFVAKTLAHYGLDMHEQETLVGSSHYQVNGRPVVVRVARQNAQGGWQWTVKHLPKGAAVILVAVCDDGHSAFVIPNDAAKDRTRYDIRAHPLKYTGWMARYLGAWSALTGELEVA